jgi:hypothetical protein
MSTGQKCFVVEPADSDCSVLPLAAHCSQEDVSSMSHNYTAATTTTIATATATAITTISFK